MTNPSPTDPLAKAVPPPMPGPTSTPSIHSATTVPAPAPMPAPTTPNAAPVTPAGNTVANFVANGTKPGNTRVKKTPSAPPTIADALKGKDADNPPERDTSDLVPGTNKEENSDFLEEINDKFKSIHITAGLGITFVVLIILIWMLIPTASGFTRFQLLWFTLIGETKLTTDNAPTKSNESNTGTATPIPLTSTPNPTIPGQSPIPGRSPTPTPTPAPTIPLNNPPLPTGGINWLDLSSIDFNF